MLSPESEHPPDADRSEPQAVPEEHADGTKSSEPRSEPATGYTVAPVVVEGRRRGLPVLTIAIALVAVLAGGALFMSGYSLGRREAVTPGTPPGQDATFQPFWDAYHTIVERYAGGEVDPKTLIEGAIRGMIESLQDPYSSYLTPEEYQQSLEGISGQFEGIGAEIGTQNAAGETADCTTLGPDCRLVIVSPLDGSPAQAAGLRAGDVITAVDGSSLDGGTIDDARDHIRGERGTEVVLTVIRDGAAPFTLAIVRDVIQQREVVSEALADETVGYIRLAGFSDGGARQMREALEAHLDAGRTRIVLDLRGNPGGFVTAARSVASQFIGSGPIFWQEDASGAQVSTDAEAGGLATDPAIKLVVLVDRGSASASEIVAGAIKDTKRGLLVGEKTFGKGTVQQWTPLDDNAGGFRLTVAKWLTPAKNWIHGTGIQPDVAVDPTAANGDEDPILDAGLEALGASAQRLRPAA